MEYNPLNGLYVEHFNEQEDFQENKALMEGNFAHGAIMATFSTPQSAEDALLALTEAGFEDAALELVRPEDVRQASDAANAAVSTPSADHPDPAASDARAAPLMTVSTENGAARVTVTPGPRLNDAQRILREHGGELGVTTDKGVV